MSTSGNSKHSNKMSSQHHMTSSEPFPPKTPCKLRLYNMQYCPYAQRITLLLAFKNVDHEVININLKDKPAWFLKKYQPGTVPVVEIDDKIIGESLIIAEYIDEVYSKPGEQLFPTEPYEKAKSRLLIYDLEKIIPKFYNYMRHNQNSEAEFHASLRNLENFLSSKKFISGEAVGYVDLMIWPWFERVGIWCPGLPQTTFPNINRWMSDMSAVPVVKACSTPTDLSKRFADSYRANKPIYDF